MLFFWIKGLESNIDHTFLKWSTPRFVKTINKITKIVLKNYNQEIKEMYIKIFVHQNLKEKFLFLIEKYVFFFSSIGFLMNLKIKSKIIQWITLNLIKLNINQKLESFEFVSKGNQFEFFLLFLSIRWFFFQKKGNQKRLKWIFHRKSSKYLNNLKDHWKFNFKRIIRFSINVYGKVDLMKGSLNWVY